MLTRCFLTELRCIITLILCRKSRLPRWCGLTWGIESIVVANEKIAKTRWVIKTRGLVSSRFWFTAKEPYLWWPSCRQKHETLHVERQCARVSLGLCPLSYKDISVHPEVLHSGPLSNFPKDTSSKYQGWFRFPPFSVLHNSDTVLLWVTEGPYYINDVDHTIVFGIRSQIHKTVFFFFWFLTWTKIWVMSSFVFVSFWDRFSL